MIEITKDQFNKAIMAALQACKQAKWTDFNRRAFYHRIEAQIQHEVRKECDNGEINNRLHP